DVPPPIVPVECVDLLLAGIPGPNLTGLEVRLQGLPGIRYVLELAAGNTHASAVGGQAAAAGCGRSALTGGSRRLRCLSRRRRRWRIDRRALGVARLQPVLELVHGEVAHG